MLFSTVKGRISGESKVPLEWNPPMGTFRDTGAKYTPPPKKAKPAKAAQAAQGKPKAFDLDALKGIFVLHGKGVPGRIEIGEDRLFRIAEGPEFNAGRKAVNALLAKNETSFERVKPGAEWVILYLTPGEGAEAQEAENAAVGDE